MNAQEVLEDDDFEFAGCPAPPGADPIDRADFVVDPPPPAWAPEPGADAELEDLALDYTEDNPDGYDHRRDIYAKGREDAFNQCSAYHLATHTPHLKNCPICVQANTKTRLIADARSKGSRSRE